MFDHIPPTHRLVLWALTPERPPQEFGLEQTAADLTKLIRHAADPMMGARYLAIRTNKNTSNLCWISRGRYVDVRYHEHLRPHIIEALSKRLASFKCPEPPAIPETTVQFEGTTSAAAADRLMRMLNNYEAVANTLRDDPT